MNTTKPTTSPHPSWIAGVDLSGHNPLNKVDFTRLKHSTIHHNGVNYGSPRFGMVKVSEGDRYFNEAASWQIRNFMRESPYAMVTSPYHFVRLDIAARSNAEHFFESADIAYADAGVTRMFEPYADFEWIRNNAEHEAVVGDELADYMLDFFYHADKLFDRPVGIYTGVAWWNGKLGAKRSEPLMVNRPLWLARHRAAPDKVPPGFAGFEFWQAGVADAGEIAGCACACDYNIYPGTEAGLMEKVYDAW